MTAILIVCLQTIVAVVSLTLKATVKRAYPESYGTPTHRRNTASYLAPGSRGRVVDRYQAAPNGATAHRIVQLPSPTGVCDVVALGVPLGGKECPHDEMHKSCAFHDEYTCWQESDRMDRVRLAPKRLPHCRSGCYCKKGLVREFPGGHCISAILCRNRKLREVLRKIPTDFPDYKK